MGSATPREAVEELLKSGSDPPFRTPSDVADLSTLRLAVERRAHTRCVMGGTYNDGNGADRYFIAFGTQIATRTWIVSAAQSGLVTLPDVEPAPHYALRWHPESCDFAGYMVDPYARRAQKVRLTDGDGRTLNIDVAHRWAAVAANLALRAPLTVDVLDAHGSIVWAETNSDGPNPWEFPASP